MTDTAVRDMIERQGKNVVSEISKLADKFEITERLSAKLWDQNNIPIIEQQQHVIISQNDTLIEQNKLMLKALEQLVCNTTIIKY